MKIAVAGKLVILPAVLLPPWAVCLPILANHIAEKYMFTLGINCCSKTLFFIIFDDTVATILYLAVLEPKRSDIKSWCHRTIGGRGER